MANVLGITVLVLHGVVGYAAGERPRCDLNGSWDFYADVGDADLAQVTSPPGKIDVPGAWQTQGYGPAGGSIPSSVVGSDISSAEYLRHNLTARCLYVRDVEIPATWQGRRVFLCVRRVYRYADIAVNAARVGQHEGFCSPCEFDITSAVRWGQSNRIVIGVDNRQRPGRDTVGTANYFGNWGGIGGAVYLEARTALHVADVFAMPKLATSEVVLRTTVTNVDDAAPGDLRLDAEVRLVPPAFSSAEATGDAPATASLPIAAPLSANSSQPLDLPVALPHAHLWTPDTPFLYTARVQLRRGDEVLDEMTVRFGMREITAQGDKLLLNGAPLYLSGYGDDATEPVTGMLPADKELYRRRLTLMRGLGFNFVRHHSCVPHDEYLEAADEVGMLVQPEAGMAYIKYWPKAHALFTSEWPQIICALRNHPCIWAWCMGNEMFLDQLPDGNAKGDTFTRERALDIVARAYSQAKELDPTRLVHASDGGTPHPHTDVLSSGGQARGAKPFLLHEYGTYACSLPDFALIPRLNGVIRPLTYERAEQYVREHKLESVYPRLYESSLKMRADAQKHYIEAAKASDNNAGFSFWLGIDFPDSPEGCWDEGILNQLWEPKPHLTDGLPNVAGATVLLCDAGLDSRSFYNDAPKKVGLRLWHYGTKPVVDARLVWRVTEHGQVLAEGAREGIACAVGQKIPIGEVTIDGVTGEAPRFVALEVQLLQGSACVAQNAWEFYAYPRSQREAPAAGVYSEVGALPGAVELRPDQPVPPDARVLITGELTRARHAELLRRGSCSVLLLGAGGFHQEHTGYFVNQQGAAFGGIIEDHPVFATIPHDGRLHLGLYQLIAGGGLLAPDAMCPPLRDGSVVWGLQLTAWISPTKDLHKALYWSEVVTDSKLHFVLCSLDLRSDRPESRYVLQQTIDYLLQGKPSGLARPCTVSDLEGLLR